MGNTELLLDRTKLFDDSSADVRGFVSRLFDADSFVQLGTFTVGSSLLSGDETPGEGVVTGYATLGGSPVYFFAHNAAVLSGSIGEAQCKKIASVMDKALDAAIPFVSIIDCSGARVGEGVSMLEGYASLLSRAVKLKNSVPHIVVIKGKCVGMLATYAALADFVIASDSSVVCFNPPSVVAAQAGINKPLNEVFGAKQLNNTLVSATFSGVDDLRATILDLLSYVELFASDECDDPNRTDINLAAYDSRSILTSVVDNGKCLEYCPSFGTDVICAFAHINNVSVGIVANNAQDSDVMTGKGVKKTVAFLKLLEKFGLPLVTLVNSNGLKPCMQCELNGIALHTAELVEAVAALPAKVCAIVGNAVGFSYAAFASKALGYGYSLAVCDSVLSPVAPDVAVNLFADDIKAAADPVAARAEIEKKYVEDAANPFVAAKDGYVDNIIESSALRPYLANALLMVLGR